MTQWRGVLVALCGLSAALPAVGYGVDLLNDSGAVTKTLDVSARIIGGRLSAEGDWPSVASLLSTEAHLPAELRHYCGATLIDPYWVLTAAHCVFDFSGNRLSPERIRVLTGVADLRLATANDEYGVAQIIVHPDYDVDVLSSPNDIALLELDAPSTATPLALHRADDESLSGTTASIVGWGAVRIDEQSGDPADYSPEQQVAELPIVSNAVCNGPDSYNNLIVDSQLCAGFADGGVDACAGDSGGPLIIGIDGLQVQTGIVSFGRGCAEPRFYGVYTRVSAFESWISDYVAAEFRSREPVTGIRQPQDSVSSGGGAAAAILLIALGVLSGCRARRAKGARTERRNEPDGRGVR